jgi:hypothetical protein
MPLILCVDLTEIALFRNSDETFNAAVLRHKVAIDVALKSDLRCRVNGIFQHLCNSRDVDIFSTLRDLAGGHYASRSGAEGCTGVGGIFRLAFSR